MEISRGSPRETSIERIKEELADVLIYSHMLASNLDLDIDEIIEAKLEKNNIKYPVDRNKQREQREVYGVV